MTTSETTGHISALGTAWEQFKQVNDARLSEIERKGSADPLYSEHMARISDSLHHHKSRIDSIETSMQRPEKDATSLGFKSEGHSSEYKAAFCNYIRKGVDTNLGQLQTKALSVGSDPDGGYMVSATMTNKIISIVKESSPVREVAAIETISTDALEMIEDRGDVGAGWSIETSSITDSTTPQVGKRSIPVHEMFAQSKATQKLVDDSAVDIEQWLATKVASIFARKEATAFVTGNGVGQPRGFLTYAAGTNWGQIQQVGTGSSGNVTADSLVNLFYTLKGDYARRATFMMNRTTINAVRLLKDTTNQYLWQPGLAAGAPDTLFGVPVKQAADMPTPAAAALAVAVGDFGSAYQIVDRIGIRMLRDPFTDKPFVKFYTTKRVGGDVINFEALKLLILS